MTERDDIPKGPSFDSDTKRYYREVIWPRQRQLRNEKEAAILAEEQRVAEEIATLKQGRIESYKRTGLDSLSASVAALKAHIESERRQLAYSESVLEELNLALDQLTEPEQDS